MGVYLPSCGIQGRNRNRWAVSLNLCPCSPSNEWVSCRVVSTSQGGGLAPEGPDTMGSSKGTITKGISMIPRVGMAGGKVLPVHNNHTHHYCTTTNLPFSLHTNLPTISVAVSMSRSGRRATETESKPWVDWTSASQSLVQVVNVCLAGCSSDPQSTAHSRGCTNGCGEGATGLEKT